MRSLSTQLRQVWVIGIAIFVVASSSVLVLVSSNRWYVEGVTADLLSARAAHGRLSLGDGPRGNWTNTTPAFSPPPVYGGATMTYVPELRGSMLFGGTFDSNETWRYRSDEKNWTRLAPSSAPPPTLGASTAYDPNVGKVVLFGGLWERADHLLCVGNETWIYDPVANTWTNVTTPDSPPRRWDAGMVYDPGTQRIVLFGGHRLRCGLGIPEDTGPRLSDTWTYDAQANTWGNVTGPIAPPARSSTGLVYDSKESRIVLFGGTNSEPYQAASIFDDTWVFDPTTYGWRLSDPVVRPTARYGQGMAFLLNVTILYGGCSTTGCYTDMWSYVLQTASWSAISSNPGPPFAPGAAFVYDPGGVVVAFGKSDTWEFRMTSSAGGPPPAGPPSPVNLVFYGLVISGAAGGAFVAAWWFRVRRIRTRRP